MLSQGPRPTWCRGLEPTSARLHDLCREEQKELDDEEKKEIQEEKKELEQELEMAKKLYETLRKAVVESCKAEHSMGIDEFLR